MATTPSSATGAAKAAAVAFDKDAVPRDPVPRNPVPLSAGQEQQVRDLYHKRVRQRCADEVKGKRQRLAWRDNVRLFIAFLLRFLDFFLVVRGESFEAFFHREEFVGQREGWRMEEKPERRAMGRECWASQY